MLLHAVHARRGLMEGELLSLDEVSQPLVVVLEPVLRRLEEEVVVAPELLEIAVVPGAVAAPPRLVQAIVVVLELLEVPQQLQLRVALLPALPECVVHEVVYWLITFSRR